MILRAGPAAINDGSTVDYFRPLSEVVSVADVYPVNCAKANASVWQWQYYLEQTQDSVFVLSTPAIKVAPASGEVEVEDENLTGSAVSGSAEVFFYTQAAADFALSVEYDLSADTGTGNADVFFDITTDGGTPFSDTDSAPSASIAGTAAHIVPASALPIKTTISALILDADISWSYNFKITISPLT